MNKKGNLFLKEINGFILSVTDQYVISPAARKGAFLLSGTLYVYSQDRKSRHEAPLLTATGK